MKLHFDEKADALYLRLDDAPVIDSQEVSAGIVLDFNDRSQVVGIEVLDLNGSAISSPDLPLAVLSRFCYRSRIILRTPHSKMRRAFCARADVPHGDVRGRDVLGPEVVPGQDESAQ